MIAFQSVPFFWLSKAALATSNLVLAKFAVSDA